MAVVCRAKGPDGTWYTLTGKSSSEVLDRAEAQGAVVAIEGGEIFLRVTGEGLVGAGPAPQRGSEEPRQLQLL